MRLTERVHIVVCSLMAVKKLAISIDAPLSGEIREHAADHHLGRAAR